MNHIVFFYLKKLAPRFLSLESRLNCLDQEFRKMKKIPVTRFLYKCSTTLFYFICLSGLIWQITLISVNYFKYDIVSDIKVIMPRSQSKKSLNVCFWLDQVLDYEMYVELVINHSFVNTSDRDNSDQKHGFVSNLTVGERFKLVINRSHFLLSSPGNRYEILDFIFAFYHCYHISNLNPVNTIKFMTSPLVDPNTESYRVPAIYLRNATLMRIVSSPVNRLPWDEFANSEFITDIQTLGKEVAFYITSFSYFTRKLKTPYVDHCVDYREFNYADKQDAISSCMNAQDLSTTNELSKAYAIARNETQYYSYRIDNGLRDANLYRHCFYQYQNDDCERESTFTQTITKKYLPTKETNNTILIKQISSKQPSFNIESKPMIADIDFVTFILGALGSWIGFSFLNLNPIRFVLKVKKRVR